MTENPAKPPYADCRVHRWKHTIRKLRNHPMLKSMRIECEKCGDGVFFPRVRILEVAGLYGGLS